MGFAGMGSAALVCALGWVLLGTSVCRSVFKAG